MNRAISDFDFVFLSFDEPNAELLYADLCKHVPWAKRVHGVKGFDAAHRACADASETDFFITVDGDNQVYPEFLDVTIDIREDQDDHAWTWAGRNHINGLVYGNGGLKLWSKKFVYGMNSHEHASNEAGAVDFCWDSKYHDVQGCYSTSITNASPQQAWRSGFREGVKMCLDQGNRISCEEFHSRIWYGNMTRLCIWSSVGQDVENGIWAMYGTRMGCYRTLLTTLDHTVISNYDSMQRLWNGIKHHDPVAGCHKIGDMLKKHLDLAISVMSPDDSRFFKTVYMNPPRPWMGWDQIKHFMATRYV